MILRFAGGRLPARSARRQTGIVDGGEDSEDTLMRLPACQLNLQSTALRVLRNISGGCDPPSTELAAGS